VTDCGQASEGCKICKWKSQCDTDKVPEMVVYQIVAILIS
jgi:hypothetical protein